MSIAGVTESSLVQPENAIGKKDMERSDFMTLFITQLQYQDPMKPMDSYEMASQLAQFSNMEATMKMSENMEKLLEYQTSQNNLQLLTLLDNEVQFSGNMMGVVDGVATSTEFDLLEGANSVKVEVFDAAGRPVWQQQMGSLQTGTYEVNWDGMNMVGDPVEDGAYEYVVTALDVDGSQVGIDYRSTGTVTGVNFDSGTAMLTIDGFIETGVADVSKVK